MGKKSVQDEGLKYLMELGGRRERSMSGYKLSAKSLLSPESYALTDDYFCADDSPNVVPRTVEDRNDYFRALFSDDKMGSLTIASCMNDLIRQRCNWMCDHKNLFGKRILNICSGSGVFACFLAKVFPSAQIVGIDWSCVAVEFSRKLADKLNVKNVKFIQVDDILSFSDGVFDTVYITDIMPFGTVTHSSAAFPDLKAHEIYDDPWLSDFAAFAWNCLSDDGTMLWHTIAEDLTLGYNGVYALSKYGTLVSDGSYADSARFFYIDVYEASYVFKRKAENDKSLPMASFADVIGNSQVNVFKDPVSAARFYDGRDDDGENLLCVHIGRGRAYGKFFSLWTVSGQTDTYRLRVYSVTPPNTESASCETGTFASLTDALLWARDNISAGRDELAKKYPTSSVIKTWVYDKKCRMAEEPVAWSEFFAGIDKENVRYGKPSHGKDDEPLAKDVPSVSGLSGVLTTVPASMAAPASSVPVALPEQKLVGNPAANVSQGIASTLGSSKAKPFSKFTINGKKWEEVPASSVFTPPSSYKERQAFSFYMAECLLRYFLQSKRRFKTIVELYSKTGDDDYSLLSAKQTGSLKLKRYALPHICSGEKGTLDVFIGPLVKNGGFADGLYDDMLSVVLDFFKAGKKDGFTANDLDDLLAKIVRYEEPDDLFFSDIYDVYLALREETASVMDVPFANAMLAAFNNRIQPSRSKTRALSSMKHIASSKKYAESTAFNVTVENIASDMASAASCVNAHAFFDMLRQYHPSVYFGDPSENTTPVPLGWMRGFLSQYLYLMNAHGYDAAASMGDMPTWTDDYLMHHLKEAVASVLLDLIYDRNVPADMAGKISKKSALKLADFPDASVLYADFATRLFIDGLLSGVDRLEDSFYSLAVFESGSRKSDPKAEDMSSAMEQKDAAIEELTTKVESLEKELAAKTALLDQMRRDAAKKENAEIASLNKTIQQKDKALEQLQEKYDSLDAYVQVVESGDDEDTSVDQDTAVDWALLSSKKYVFVGGHEDLILCLKRNFPSSIFVTKPSDPISFANVDYVVYFPKFLSHAVFDKCFSAMKTKKLPFMIYTHKNEEMLYRMMQSRIGGRNGKKTA